MGTQHETIGVLLSGGVDSAVVLARLLANGHRISPLYVRCGFVWEVAELSWVRRFLRAVRHHRVLPLQVIEVPLRSTYGPHWSLTGRLVPTAASPDAAVYLPGRNVLLLTHAAIVCARRKISVMALGTLKGNPFGDASPKFFAQMARCLRHALGAPIRILTPLRHMTKACAIRSAAALPLNLTFSCLRPHGHRHCGRCNKCAERRRAFRDAGITDSTQYATR